MAVLGRYSLSFESSIGKPLAVRVFLSHNATNEVKWSSWHNFCYHFQLVAALPVSTPFSVREIAWVFKCRGLLQTAWTRKALTPLVLPGGGLVLSKLSFLLHAASLSCFPEDLAKPPNSPRVLF